ncbi:hypothetical protein HMPREF9946_02645 [Acetobacteraceae bacterium AT-5844]|nr:hypothetical protein HMPREF9946_02645 [Acetobacteraceae bacterium AT-5844]
MGRRAQKWDRLLMPRRGTGATLAAEQSAGSIRRSGYGAFVP